MWDRPGADVGAGTLVQEKRPQVRPVTGGQDHTHGTICLRVRIARRAAGPGRPHAGAGSILLLAMVLRGVCIRRKTLADGFLGADDPSHLVKKMLHHA